MTTPATNRQVPDNAILDRFNKQIYLGNQFVASRALTVGTAETPLILLNNTQTGSATIVKSVFQGLIKVAQNTASESVIINVYVNPTVTGAGTALTKVNLRSAYGVTGSVVTATYSPTVSSNGTLIDMLSVSALSVGVSDLLKIIDNGQKLLLTSVASNAGVNIVPMISWYEL